MHSAPPLHHVPRTGTTPNAFRPGGFTLIELLVVVAILAIVGGGVIVALAGVQGDAEMTVARAEMEQVREAIARFRADTGELPKHGPFALVDEGGKIDPADPDHWPEALAGANATERTEWFEHPANLYQLFEHRGDADNLLLVAGCFERILDPGADPNQTWNAATGRGYRGPYLGRDGAARAIDGLPPMPMILDTWGRAYRLHVDPAEALGLRLVSFGPNGTDDSDATVIGGDDLAIFLND